MDKKKTTFEIIKKSKSDDLTFREGCSSNPSYAPVINIPHIYMKTTRIVFIRVSENCVSNAFTINMLLNTFHARCFSTAVP